MPNKRLELMQLGRRASYLKRCIIVSNLLEEHENDMSIRVRVFEKFIKPVMNCSYVTFNNMINERNPQKELLEIENKIKLLKRQPILEPIIKKVVVVDDEW